MSAADLIGIDTQRHSPALRDQEKIFEGLSPALIYRFKSLATNCGASELEILDQLARKMNSKPVEPTNHNSWKINADTDSSYRYVSPGIPVCRTLWIKHFPISLHGDRRSD
jgi:hypothetical protein